MSDVETGTVNESTSHTPNSVGLSQEKKKKKRKYTYGTQGFQTLERGITTSFETVAEGMTKILHEYNGQRNKSSRKKRDGAIKDAIENWAKALSEGAGTVGSAPLHFVKTVRKGGACSPFKYLNPTGFR